MVVGDAETAPVLQERETGKARDYTGVRSSVMGFKTTELLQSTGEKGSSVKVRSLHNDLITLLNNKGLKVDVTSPRKMTTP
jgi:hypothetical protein